MERLPRLSASVAPDKRLVRVRPQVTLVIVVVASLVLGSVSALLLNHYRQDRLAASVTHHNVDAYLILSSANETGLIHFDASVSTPGSANFGRFLTTAQFADRFGASESDIGMLRNYFSSYRMSTERPWANRLVMEVKGSVPEASKALGVSFHEVRVGSLGQYPEADQLPALPPKIQGAVVAVVGLFPNGNIPSVKNQITENKTYQLVRYRRSTAKGFPAKASMIRSNHTTGSVKGCAAAQLQAYQQGAYLPNQISALYQMTPFYRLQDYGQNVVAAFPEFTNPQAPDSAFVSSVKDYLKCFSISPRSISYYQVAGGSANHSTNNLEEASLDVENFLSLAPKARAIIYSSTQANSDLMFMQMVAQDRADLIVSSWGSCEADTFSPDVQAEYLAFLEAAAQGQSVMSAAGDDGSADCWSSGHNTSLSVDDPASQPYVTGVGGVQYNGPLASTPPSVWNDPNYSGGTGGGVSTLWPTPTYQSQIYHNDQEAVSNCAIQLGCRLVPDVSTLGEGFLVHTPTYGWDVIGGTSGSTPIFASGVALMQSYIGHRLGFLNPFLYKAYQDSTATFTDVQRGNNDYHHVNDGLYKAIKGYDVASGLGTPRFFALASSYLRFDPSR